VSAIWRIGLQQALTVKHCAELGDINGLNASALLASHLRCHPFGARCWITRSINFGCGVELLTDTLDKIMYFILSFCEEENVQAIKLNSDTELSLTSA
jgi:hypothetical protein